MIFENLPHYPESANCAELMRDWIVGCLNGEHLLAKTSNDESNYHALSRIYKKESVGRSKSLFDEQLYKLATFATTGHYASIPRRLFQLIGEVGNPQAKYCLICIVEDKVSFEELSLSDRRTLLNTIADRCVHSTTPGFWISLLLSHDNKPKPELYIHQVISGLMRISYILVPSVLPLLPDEKSDAVNVELKLDIIYEDYSENDHWSQFVEMLKRYQPACKPLIEKAIETFLHEKNLVS